MHKIEKALFQLGGPLVPRFLRSVGEDV